MKVTKRQWIYIGVGSFVVLLVLWGLFRETPVTVDTGTCKRGPMVVTVDGEGTTRVRQKHTITAPVSGKLFKIKLTEGDRIPHDYPVAEIDPNPPIQREADLNDDLPSPYTAKVFSPADGRVLRVLEKSEGFVAAGTPLVEIGDTDNIEIVVDLLSTDAARVPPGATMLIEDPDRTQQLKGRVRLIESQAITKVSALGVEEQRVNVIGDFLSKTTGYGDNYRVDVRIVIWESGNVLSVPASALFRNGEDWNVFVVEYGRAQPRAVKIGQQNADSAQVLEGLTEGETVILHPSNNLKAGSYVTPR